ncbi:MAG: Asp-tRNA(Asn)/Glu-tRNA(Gln) amidotransferase subunit GatB [Gemmatimonadota bacterium]|nr:MAG: Asp-tRNA(Asn)/Glu-tRNA(Gln) amidotransferase subunit GatB [Gemmatimonadota bacterium]
MSTAYETVIGLEVHVQLLTEEKLFCSDKAEFGASPNTRVCPVCLGLPGALPVLNGQAVDLALRAALALGCDVQESSGFARKNYFYPDLPKGYQITQFELPLATGGALTVATEKGERTVRVRRIHMEEDAGKMLHDRVPDQTAVDLNRAGVPLVEIVTEPDLRTPTEARSFLVVLKQILGYVGASDCNMEEGSLRVDANVSIRPIGATEPGTKTEVKNLNSFSAVAKAIAGEVERQEALLSAGEPVIQQTLLWDGAVGMVRPMRSKEESHDYRYFPEPDLPPLTLDRARIEDVRASLPELPAARRRRFVEQYGLPDYDAGVLTASRTTAEFFEALAEVATDAKAASNWVMGPLMELANQRGGTVAELPFTPEEVAEVLALVADGTISHRSGKDVLALIAESDRRAAEIVESEGIAQVVDQGLLDAWIDEVVGAHPEEVQRYRAGEVKVLGFLVGRVMRASQGRADPKRVDLLLKTRL